MKKPLVFLALLAGVSILLASCANQGAVVVTGLTVELMKLQRADDGSVSVQWRMMNPNVAPYLLMQVKNTIYLNGKIVGTTLTDAPFGVAARSNSAPMESNLKLADSGAGQAVANAVGSGTAEYRVDSSVTVRIFDEDKEHGELSNSGTVKVVGK